MPPLAHVRLGYSDLATQWIVAVALLLEEIEHADAMLVTDEILEQAKRVREIMWTAAARGD